MKKYLFGVDIGGTTVKIGFFSSEGTMLESWEIPTRKEESGKYILSDIAESVLKKMEEKKLSREDVLGCGMGVPGPVIRDAIVNKCANLGWPKYDVAEEFTRISGLPCKVGNDANMAALGEMWKGGGAGFDDVVFITLGTGVGGGVIINGKIICGANGAGGEIGHMNVVEDEEDACGCGNHGCLEQYASATGIVRVAKRMLAKPHSASALDNKENLTCKDVFDEAKNGDALAKECVRFCMSMLGKAMASIACVADPEVFVIGGGVSRAGAIITDEIRSSYEHYAFHACRKTKFELATLGNDAGMYGAAKLILG